MWRSKEGDEQKKAAEFVTRVNNQIFETSGDYDPVTNPFGKRPEHRTPQAAEAARKRLSLGPNGTPAPNSSSTSDAFRANLDLVGALGNNGSAEKPETVRGALEDAAIKLSSLGQALDELSPPRPRRHVKDDDWEISAENPVFSSLNTPRDEITSTAAAAASSPTAQTPPRSSAASPAKSTPRTPGSAQKVGASGFPRSFPVKPVADDSPDADAALAGGLAGWMRRHKALLKGSGSKEEAPVPVAPATGAPEESLKPASRNGAGLKWLLLLLLLVAGVVTIVMFPVPSAALWQRYAPAQVRAAVPDTWQQVIPARWRPEQTKPKPATLLDWRPAAAIRQPAAVAKPVVHKQTPVANKPAPKPAKVAPVPATKVVPAVSTASVFQPKSQEPTKVPAAAVKQAPAVHSTAANTQKKQQPVSKTAKKAAASVIPSTWILKIDEILGKIKSLWTGQTTPQKPQRPQAMPAAALMAGAAGMSLAAGIVAAFLRRSTGGLIEFPLGPSTTPTVGGRVRRARSRSAPRGRTALPSRSPARQRSASRSRKASRTPANATVTTPKTPRTRLVSVLDSAAEETVTTTAARGRSTRRSTRV